ncbi:helix-turn-helix transcriptional regulator [Candidatus Methylacidithermus pantelleriae]|nr:winged helix-turn-helix transcriptional regulator [Candidatus Methylacidithermus pantelleriae]
MSDSFSRKALKGHKLQILSEIKRSDGLSVGELCKRVKLSYMGIKQHCVALEREGFLATCRRPKLVGRPEKAYRLTPRANEFFPNEYTQLTCAILQTIADLYGPATPLKILYRIYQREGERAAREIGEVALEERIRQWVAMREVQGYMPEVRRPEKEGDSWVVVEYHSPILPILDLYPVVRELEKRLYEQVLGVPVIREEARPNGLYRCSFLVFVPMPPPSMVSETPQENG